MKKALTNNIGLKLLSLLFAIIFWLIVVNIDDPVVSRTIQGIPVTPLDEQLITDENQMYTIISGNEVTVTVKGPRSEVDKMTKDYFIAEAPFSEKSNVNAVPIYVKFRNSKYDKDVEITQKTMTMKLNIEDIVNKTYQIEVNHTNNLPAGYYLGKETLSSPTVTLTAPTSIINQIATARVDIDLSSYTSDISTQANIKFYTENGSLVETGSNSSMNIQSLNYSAKVYTVRELPIKFGSKGTVADGYQVTEVTGEKTTLRVAGPNAEQIESIVIPDELVDVTGATSDVVVEVNLAALLPSGVELYNKDDDKMKVTAKIDKLITNTYRIPVSEIDKNNTPTGFNAEFSDASVSIRLTGLQKAHDAFSVDNLNAYVDLKNTTAGNNEVIIKVTLPNGLKLEEDPRAIVVLNKSQESTIQPTTQETTTTNETTKTQ